MPRSTYISENITGEQLRLVHELSEQEIDWFRLENIQAHLKSQYANIQELVENLTQKGFLKRVERGIYVNPNFNDAQVIGTLLIKNGAIAYWSALHLHGLTSRFPGIVFVQSTQRKRSKTAFGVSYKFITVSKRKFKGIITNGYGNYSYPITDIEKTIVDCFDLPQYSGGFNELLTGFALAKLKSQKLIEYCDIINNIAATKRMGFLAELLQKKGTKSFVLWARKQVNQKYNLMDSGGIESGEFVKEWKLRLNVSREELINMAREIY
jgi:predicted transcriptional regulator of viral defense system